MCRRLKRPQCPAHALCLLLSPLLSGCECVELNPRPVRASLLHQIPLNCFTIKGSRWKPGEAALSLKILLRKFFDLHSQSFTPPSSASCLSCPFLLSHIFRLSPFLHPTGKISQFFPLVSFYVFSRYQNSIRQVILTTFSCGKRFSIGLSTSLIMTGQDIFLYNESVEYCVTKY